MVTVATTTKCKTLSDRVEHQQDSKMMVKRTNCIMIVIVGRVRMSVGGNNSGVEELVENDVGSLRAAPRMRPPERRGVWTPALVTLTVAPPPKPVHKTSLPSPSIYTSRILNVCKFL
jgi:hypothetical protein